MQSTSPGRMGRLLGSLAIQVWVFAFLVFFGSEIVHLDPLLRLTAQLLFGVPLVAWALLRLRGPMDRLDLAVLVSVAVFASRLPVQPRLGRLVRDAGPGAGVRDVVLADARAAHRQLGA